MPRPVPSSQTSCFPDAVPGCAATRRRILLTTAASSSPVVNIRPWAAGIDAATFLAGGTPPILGYPRPQKPVDFTRWAQIGTALVWQASKKSLGICTRLSLSGQSSQQDESDGGQVRMAGATHMTRPAVSTPKIHQRSDGGPTCQQMASDVETALREEKQMWLQAPARGR